LHEGMKPLKLNLVEVGSEEVLIGHLRRWQVARYRRIAGIGIMKNTGYGSGLLPI
jgi:hypothetical protein